MRELTQTFILCVVCLITLILISRGIQMRNLFLGLALEPFDVAVLFLYMIPSFLSLILPISCMLSVFLTFLRMSTDRELIALKAGGVSVYKMLAAPLIFSALCMVLSFLISAHGIAWGMGHFRATILEIANTRAKIVIQPGVVNPNISGMTLFARQVNPETGELKEVIFEDSTQGEGTSITILAPRGAILTDEDKGQLIFELFDGRLYRVDDAQFSILSFTNYSIHLDLSDVLTGVRLDDLRPKEMSLSSLRRILRNKDDNEEKVYNRAAVEIQKRWSLPVACLVLGMFAVPLACSFEGVRRQLGVVLSLVFFLVYYSLYSVGLTIGESGLISPVVSLWTPNIIFLVAALLGLRLVARERVPTLSGLFRPKRPPEDQSRDLPAAETEKTR